MVLYYNHREGEERKVKEMTELTLTMIVITLGITAISYMTNKMVQEIKRYNEVKARMERAEQRRNQARQEMKRLAELTA